MQNQLQIWVAIMLRMIKTRFFGHGLGFLVSIAWPMVHILFLLGLSALAKRSAPYGESLTIFFATGLVPFLTFSYMSRFIQLAVVHNRPLLHFPAVKVTDLLFGAAILEILAQACSVLLLLIILAAFGIDIMPQSPAEAAYALCASALLGLAAGIVAAVLAMAVPTMVTVWALIQIILYMISGLVFVPDSLPETVRYYASFNPALQVVEWMRSAYYDGYGSTLDRFYTLAFGTVLLFIGLLSERLFRGRLLTV